MKKYLLPLCTFIPILTNLTSSGCVSIRPVYNSDEQALAARSVSDLHRLYNEQKFDEIFELFDQEAKQSLNREEVLESMRQSFERMGVIRNARLSQTKVLPGPPIQVRMVYYLETEKGPFQEWLIWINRGSQSSLGQVQTFPGHGTLESK